MTTTTARRKRRTITVSAYVGDVDVDLDLDDLDLSPEDLGITIGSVLDSDPAASRIQQAFYNYGPERERLCDWRRCQEQPWKAIAEALGVAL